ncbi:MAG: UDP-N-acetylglucosamine 1-carboxyvinyltransferase [Nitrospirota bacterium]
MESMIIQGEQRLAGSVRIGGAKNAALPILAATLLGNGSCTLSNVPRVVDVFTMSKLLAHLGARVESNGDFTTVSVDEISSCRAPYELVKTMRASVLVLGPLLARHGKAFVALPGGCAIGARPINLHLTALERMGAEITIEHGNVHARVLGRLRGAQIYFDVSTVTGTENIMMAACLADGTTVIENAAGEPEIADLAQFLITRGARISGAGTDVITIQGVPALHGADHEIIPDRIETATYLVAGAITKGDVTVERCRPDHSEALLAKLREAGAELTIEKETIRIRAPERLGCLDVKTLPYPGFPTDIQAQMMALMAVAQGSSMITETVFESRFMHVLELQRMGAEIRIDGNHAVVTGVERLSGAPVMASDLRASACLILAGLAAEGETRVGRVYHLDRGYEQLEQKLVGLGARVRRAQERL